MPIGVLIDTLAILLGGCIGALARNHIRADFRDNMNLVMACCSMTIGVNGITKMQNLPAVVFSMTVGTAIGLCIHLGRAIQNTAGLAQRYFLSCRSSNSPEGGSLMVTAIILFCASGTGIYGSMVSGMTGDHSILLAKSILDLFTASIFACSLGWSVCLITIPQCVVFLLLFFLAAPIAQSAAPEMIGDFKAVGGIIMLATGLRIAKLKDFPVADMLPAMVMVMPISRFWMECIHPWVAQLSAL